MFSSFNTGVYGGAVCMLRPLQALTDSFSIVNI